MKLDRLLGITFYILNHRRATAGELSERFEVSRRTIYRDIESLTQAGLPLYTQKGTDGGIFLMEGYRMDSGTLTKNELREILAVLQGAQHMLAPSGVKVAADKLSILAGQKGGPIQIAMNFSAMPWEVHASIERAWRLIQGAIEDNWTISFTYINSRGQRSDRTVEPMTLVFRGLNWYLYGFCRVRQDYRLFRLSRMMDVARGQEGFTRREKEWEDVFFLEDMTYSPGERVRVLIDPTAAHKAMDLFSPEALTWLPDGTIQADINWPIGESFDSMVLSFGPHMRVVSPGWVRDRIAAVLRKMIQYYA